MTQQVIGIGTVANDGTGDPARTAFDKVNDNFTELYSLGYIAPTPTGVAVTDTDAFQAWVTACGANAVLNLVPGTTLTLDKGIQLLSGQRLIGHGATITRVNQLATTTDTDVTSGVTTWIDVTDPTGFRAGQLIALHDSGGGATDYTVGGNTIQSVVGNRITVTSAFVITNTTATLNVYLVGTSIYGADDVEITGVRFDGNRANWTFNRWDCVTEIRPRGTRARVHGNVFINIPCEAIQETALTGGTTINAGTNAITAGGTTATVADASGLSVGDYIIVSTTSTAAKSEPSAHRITDITGSVITIDSPGWWFAESSGSLDVNRLQTGNRYTDNIFQNVGGNPIHLSGSTGSHISRNQAINVNLDSDAGHRGGIISWSFFCPHAIVTDNYVKGSLYGIGNADNIHASGALIANNTVEDATTYGFKIGNSVTTPYATRDVRVIGNTFRNCGFVYVNNLGSTSTPANYVQNITIQNNNLYKTYMQFDRVSDSIISGNYIYAPGTWSSSGTEPIRVFRMNNCAIRGNTLVGGNSGIVCVAASSMLAISSNTFSQQYIYGIYPSGSSEVGMLIDGNTVLNDSSANSSYIAIFVVGPIVVRNNTVRIVKGYGIFALNNAANFVIQGNTVKGTASGRPIYCGTGQTGYIVTDNTIDYAVVDSSAAAAPARVANNDVITIA